MDIININKRIMAHKEKLISEGIDEKHILGIFLYGSQNYQCDLEDSDIDTKAIYIPSKEEAIFDRIRIKEYKLPNGEHCELMDIRHFVDNLKKQNINFVEILYTDYYWFNPAYNTIWIDRFFKYRDLISHYDMKRCVSSICGQAKHTLFQNPYNGKKVGNGLRLMYFLEHYSGNIPYKKCLIPNEATRNIIKHMKNQKMLDSRTTADDFINYFCYLEPIMLSEVDKIQKEKYKDIQENLDKNFRETIMLLIETYDFLCIAEKLEKNK